jgi:hypothetical protein
VTTFGFKKAHIRTVFIYIYTGTKYCCTYEKKVMETHIMREWKILVMLVVVLRSEVVRCWREEGRPRMVVDYLNQHAGKLNINIVKTFLLVHRTV